MMLKSDGIYFAYLRKSREDRDAEVYGGSEDTLARHEYILNDMAKRYHIKISKWYREVVSGETISDRPEMQNMLRDIEIMQPDGVLVVEVERLSRGNPQDQGRVTDTFKYAGSLIITPMKIYDLSKENDEEWLDFGLMRSRMEYRTIKRRLQNGRTTSAMQGKFVGNTPPYGWQRKKLEKEKGYTLEPNPDTSWVLKLIYTLMDTGTSETNNMPVGSTVVCRVLDRMGIKAPNGEAWQRCAVGRIVKNPSNIGMVRIGYRKQEKIMEDGQIRVSRPINDDAIIVPARWKGQIDPEVFERVCNGLKERTTRTTFCTAKSPLAGIIYCSVCGKIMRRRPKGERNKADTLQCQTYHCATVGSYYELVENRLIESLEDYLEGRKLRIESDAPDDWAAAIEIKEHLRAGIEVALDTLAKQLKKVHNSFEQDIYDLDTFRFRSQAVKQEIADKQAQLEGVERELEDIRERMHRKEEFIPRFESMLQSYKTSEDPIYKNILLKKYVEKVVYTKAKKGSTNGKGLDEFELDVVVRV